MYEKYLQKYIPWLTLKRPILKLMPKHFTQLINRINLCKRMKFHNIILS